MSKMEITADMIKDLRERTNVGMGKCKEALIKANGDMATAIEILRKEGMASSVKKESREAKEGFIGFAETQDAIVLVEVNAETDFVAKHSGFKAFLDEMAAEILHTRPRSLEDFLKQTCSSDKSITIDQYRSLLVQKFGENIQIRRLEIICKDQTASYGIYSHMGGKIVTVVEIAGSSKDANLARDIAMHVAAEDPTYLKIEEIPVEVRKKEEEIARSQVQGKPQNIVDKIVEGKLKGFADQVCLLNQKFIKDNAKSVEQYVHDFGATQNKKFVVTKFWRWKVGSQS